MELLGKKIMIKLEYDDYYQLYLAKITHLENLIHRRFNEQSDILKDLIKVILQIHAESLKEKKADE